MMKTLITLLLLLLPACAFGFTETFYVCDGGDGSLPETNTCGTAYDEADFNNSANWDNDDQNDGKMGPNDLVEIMDDGGDFDDMLVAQESGLNGLPITIRAQSGDTPVIDVNGGDLYCFDQNEQLYLTIDSITMKDSTWHNVYIHSAGDHDDDLYITVQNSDLQNAGNGVNNSARHSILVSGSNVTVTNTEMSDSQNEGIFSRGDDQTFTYNYIHDVDLNNDSGDGIQLNLDGGNYYVAYNIIDRSNTSNKGCFVCTESGASNGIFEYNLCYTNDNFAWSDTGSGSIARYNTVIGTAGGADIGAFKVGTGTVHSNLIIDQYIGFYARTAGKTANIYNNTVVGATRCLDANTANALTVNFKNNICYVDDNQQIFVVGTGPTVVSDYNLVYADATDANFYAFDGNNYASLAAFQTGTNLDINSDEADPLFSDKDSNVLTLTSTSSPAYNVGTDLGDSYDDCLNPLSSWPDGVSLMDFDDEGWNMGAYCFNVEAPVQPPLGASFKAWGMVNCQGCTIQ